jgi:hypothetical protein
MIKVQITYWKTWDVTESETGIGLPGARSSVFLAYQNTLLPGHTLLMYQACK